jgi:molybdopterin-guanine dinucleotide biosynthesis protein A
LLDIAPGPTSDPMSAASHILGVILAGGSSRRMGGGDKGFADLGGRPMLAHVGALILNANGDAARFRTFGVPVIPDLDSKAQGPLAGILAAIAWAERSGRAFTAVATVTSDVPFLPLDLVSKLAAARPNGPSVAQSADRLHPTIGLWPLSLKPAIEAALERGNLSAHAFARANDAIAVAFPFSESVGRESGGQCVDPFFNANTPDDLNQARALLTRNP